MNQRPVIFISAVRKELRTARDLVAKTLLAMGYEPKWQDIAPTEHGDLRAVLCKWIDQSAGVIQLVGQCYGFEPLEADGTTPRPDPEFRRCSYTQYEAHYAKKHDKPVWYFFPAKGFVTDPHPAESGELCALQETYRQGIHAANDVRHEFANATELENRVLRLRDELATLRAEWEAHCKHIEEGVSLTNANTTQSLANDQKILKALAEMREATERGFQGGSAQKLVQDYDAALAFIAARHDMKPAALRTLLERRADQTVADLHAGLREKVRVLREAGRFTEARDFAVEAATRLECVRRESTRVEVEMLVEACNSEIALGHYPQARIHADKADRLADREDSFEIWVKARQALGWILHLNGSYEESAGIYSRLIPLQQERQGAEHPNTLKSRDNLATALHYQGKHGEAEAEFRKVLEISEHMLGAEHLNTLISRNNLANTLRAEGKYAEAEAEHRKVLGIRERVLSTEHPDTLRSWNNLAVALDFQGKHAEAEAEHRKVLAIQERVLGAEHPETLSSRNNLAATLQSQGKHAEAEAEHRTVLAIRNRVLGAQHPDTLASRNNLATTLRAHGKSAEAEAEYRKVLATQERVLGAEHPDTLASRNNLANALYDQGKHAEAAEENRAVLAIRERVQGAKHPDTLASRNNLANALYAQGKYAVAEAEHRTVLPMMERVLGAEHSDTLKIRNNLANALSEQGKYAEAEAEHRKVLEIRERVLGAEHPDVAWSCYNLAKCLEHQKKPRDALEFARRAEANLTRSLGAEHPNTKGTKAFCEKLEAALKTQPPAAPK